MAHAYSFNYKIFLYSVLCYFVIKTPALSFFKYSFIIPYFVFVFVLVFRSSWKVKLDRYVILLFILSSSTFMSLVFSNKELVLPIFIKCILLFFAFFFRHEVKNGLRYVLFSRYPWSNLIVFRLLFLILPVSIFIQLYYPPIFDALYVKVVSYNDKLLELNQSGQRISGLLDATGTGGSFIMASFTIFFYVLERTRTGKITVASGVIITFNMLACVVVGTSGIVVLFLFFSLLPILKVKRPLIYLLIFYPLGAMLSFFFILILAINTNIKGLMYLKVLHEYGFDEMLNFASFKVLLGFYEVATVNFYYAIEHGAILGSSAAKGIYELTDIGFINEIHILGVSGFLIFNLFLCTLIFGFSYKIFSMSFSYESKLAALAGAAVLIFALLMQLKEFLFIDNYVFYLVLIFLVLSGGFDEFRSDCRDCEYNI